MANQVFHYSNTGVSSGQRFYLKDEVSGLYLNKLNVFSDFPIEGNNLVYKTGDQTISGAKTFSSPVVLRVPNFAGSSAQAGNIGELRVSGAFLYAATGSNLWGRVQLTSFS
jgi:hypothetical protein